MRQCTSSESRIQLFSWWSQYFTAYCSSLVLIQLFNKVHSRKWHSVTSSTVSLLDVLKAPTASDLYRKRSMTGNPPCGKSHNQESLVFILRMIWSLEWQMIQWGRKKYNSEVHPKGETLPMLQQLFCVKVMKILLQPLNKKNDSGICWKELASIFVTEGLLYHLLSMKRVETLGVSYNKLINPYRSTTIL